MERVIDAVPLLLVLASFQWQGKKEGERRGGGSPRRRKLVECGMIHGNSKFRVYKYGEE